MIEGRRNNSYWYANRILDIALDKTESCLENREELINEYADNISYIFYKTDIEFFGDASNFKSLVVLSCVPSILKIALSKEQDKKSTTDTYNNLIELSKNILSSKVFDNADSKIIHELSCFAIIGSFYGSIQKGYIWENSYAFPSYIQEASLLDESKKTNYDLFIGLDLGRTKNNKKRSAGTEKIKLQVKTDGLNLLPDDSIPEMRSLSLDELTSTENSNESSLERPFSFISGIARNEEDMDGVYQKLAGVLYYPDV